MKWLVFCTLLLAVTPAFGQDRDKLKPGNTYAQFQTTMGNFTIMLYPDQAPRTVANFVGLAQGTKEWKDQRNERTMPNTPYYNGLIIHRVIDGFMVQTGDPTGTGSGGPGYRFKDEFSGLSHDRAGRMSMANSGPNTNGSQFFITLAPVKYLDGKHTIFGQVIDGMDVVRKIGRVKKNRNDRPLENIVMEKVTIERIPE